MPSPSLSLGLLALALALASNLANNPANDNLANDNLASNNLANDNLADDRPPGRATPRPTTWPTTCPVMVGLGPKAHLPGNTASGPSTAHGTGERSTA